MIEKLPRPSDYQIAIELIGEDLSRQLRLHEGLGFRVLHPWSRGGGETYISDFIVSNGYECTHMIAKACIKLFPTATLNEWLGRREILNAVGVKTPKLFAREPATIIEEFVPLTLREAYRDLAPTGRLEMANKFTEYYWAMFNAGFRPTSFHDVRSHGDDVVVVDMGEDLGPPFASNKSESFNQSLIKDLFYRVVS